MASSIDVGFAADFAAGLLAAADGDALARTFLSSTVPAACLRCELYLPERRGYRALTRSGNQPVVLASDVAVANSSVLSGLLAGRVVERIDAASFALLTLGNEHADALRDDKVTHAIAMGMNLAEGRGVVVYYRAEAIETGDEDALSRLAQALASGLIGSVREEEVRRLGAIHDLVSTAAHDLRSPLSNILGWARLLRDAQEASASPMLLKSVGIIERNAESQLRVIDDLTEIVHLSSGRQALLRDAVDLEQVARRALADPDESGSSPIAFEADGDDMRTLADEARLGHALVRLAAYLRRTAGRVPDLHARLTRDPVWLTLSLEDRGPRDNEATTTSTRRNLVLAWIGAVVEAHGGQLATESDSTTRFRIVVRLPAGERIPDATARATRSQAPMAPTALQGFSILVVDDEEDVRDLHATILELHGAQVTRAASAPEAFARLTSGRFDVLVSDIGMPGEDGCSLVSRARPLVPGLVSIAVSAYSRPDDERRALDAGFDLYLIKPVDPTALVVSVASVIGHDGQR